MSFQSSVSQHAFERAQQHAQSVKEHGEAFEQMAGALKGRLLTEKQAELIKHAGQQIQQHGQIMAALVELALQNEHYPLEEYALVHQQQRQAVLLHIEAVKVILQSVHFLL